MTTARRSRWIRSTTPWRTAAVTLAGLAVLASCAPQPDADQAASDRPPSAEARWDRRRPRTTTTTTTTPPKSAPVTSTTSTTSTTIAPATCDVFLQDCVSGFGCYPTGSDPEAVCSPAGSGGQGNTCSQSGQCQAGFVCLVSAQGGSCREICEVGGPITCPSGTVCSSVSGTGIPGFGACL